MVWIPELAELASVQHGHVTRRQLLAAGVSGDRIARRVSERSLIPVHHGVYRLAGIPVTWHGQVRAALLAMGTRTAAASHDTAAALLGIDGYARDRIEIEVVGSALPLLEDVAVHRTSALEPCDIVDIDGLATTTGARTVIDLASRLDRLALTALVDNAICARTCNRSWLYRRAQRLRNGRTGVGVIMALTAPGAEGVFRSWLERNAAFKLQSAGIPAPRWNEPIRRGGMRLGIADAFWPVVDVVAEFDGMRFHSSPDDHQRDRERDRTRQLAGLTVLRFTWADVMDRPREVVAQIRQALNARGLSI